MFYLVHEVSDDFQVCLGSCSNTDYEERFRLQAAAADRGYGLAGSRRYGDGTVLCFVEPPEYDDFHLSGEPLGI